MMDQTQNQKNNGGFTAGFSLGAAAGAAFAYFLQSDEGKSVRQELQHEFKEVKKELVNQGLLPSVDMSGVEMVTHFVSHMAEFLGDETFDTDKKAVRRKQKLSPTLAKNPGKRKQKKFSGV